MINRDTRSGVYNDSSSSNDAAADGTFVCGEDHWRHFNILYVDEDLPKCEKYLTSIFQACPQVPALFNIWGLLCTFTVVSSQHVAIECCESAIFDIIFVKISQKLQFVHPFMRLHEPIPIVGVMPPETSMLGLASRSDAVSQAAASSSSKPFAIQSCPTTTDCTGAYGLEPASTSLHIKSPIYRATPSGDILLDVAEMFAMIDHIINLRVKDLGAAGIIEHAALNTLSREPIAVSDSVKLTRRELGRKCPKLLRIMYVDSTVPIEEPNSPSHYSLILEEATLNLLDLRGVSCHFTVLASGLLALERTEHAIFDLIFFADNLNDIGVVRFVESLNLVKSTAAIIVITEPILAREAIGCAIGNDVYSNATTSMPIVYGSIQRPFGPMNLSALVITFLDDSLRLNMPIHTGKHLLPVSQQLEAAVKSLAMVTSPMPEPVKAAEVGMSANDSHLR